MRIYADVNKRRYTFDEEVALAYQEKTGNTITVLYPAKIERKDVVTPPFKGRPAYVILTQAQWDSLRVSAAKMNKWVLLGGDFRPWDEHRLSLNGTKGLFRVNVKDAWADDLDGLVSAGHITAWYYLNPSEGETGIIEFVTGNPEWDSN